MITFEEAKVIESIVQLNMSSWQLFDVYQLGPNYIAFSYN